MPALEKTHETNKAGLRKRAAQKALRRHLAADFRTVGDIGSRKGCPRSRMLRRHHG